MKSLEKDRNRRYATVSDLASDVQRYLDNAPVEARPPSVIYKCQKFVRKNWAVTLAATLLISSLVAGIAGTSWGLYKADQALKAEAARAESEKAAKKLAYERLNLALDAIKSNYTGISEDLLLRDTRFKSTRNRLLEAPIPFYQQLEATLIDDDDSQARWALAETYGGLANLYHLLGKSDDRLKTGERALAIWYSLYESGGLDRISCLKRIGNARQVVLHDIDAMGNDRDPVSKDSMHDYAVESLVWIDKLLEADPGNEWAKAEKMSLNFNIGRWSQSNEAAARYQARAIRALETIDLSRINKLSEFQNAASSIGNVAFYGLRTKATKSGVTPQIARLAIEKVTNAYAALQTRRPELFEEAPYLP